MKKKMPFQIKCPKCQGKAYFSGGYSGKWLDYVCSKCRDLITVKLPEPPREEKP
jgi:DNA-directed RNA polymerase subunit RPC12/RpoP